MATIWVLSQPLTASSVLDNLRAESGLVIIAGAVVSCTKYVMLY